jgi:hypothetical protein
MSLARRATNHAVELPGWGMEPLYIAAPEQIRSAHNAEAFEFKGHIQQAYSWKERQHERP